MRRPVRPLAAVAAAAGLLLALTTVLIWATGVVWHVEQRPRNTAVSVYVGVMGASRSPWNGPNAVATLLLLAVPLAAAALAAAGAVRRRPRLIRLSAVPAAVAFVATWALIGHAYIWGGVHSTIDAPGRPIRIAIEPRPRIEAAWPAALVFSAVAPAAAIGAWWILRRARSS